MSSNSGDSPLLGIQSKLIILLQQFAGWAIIAVTAYQLQAAFALKQATNDLHNLQQEVGELQRDLDLLNNRTTVTEVIINERFKGLDSK